MRLAAIDIGSNSLHMTVVHVRPDLSFDVIDREKEMVRLGAGGLDGKPLTDDAMAAALGVLSSFRRIAESHRVDEILAVATSAVREASNGDGFLRSITRETGIRVRLISGTEEAALIHRAAIHGTGATDVVVVIDIGGGSVEITLGTHVPTTTYSLRLGVIRLTERFVGSDPLSPEDERRLVRFIQRIAGPPLDCVVRAGFARVIATSGTALSLGAVIAAENGTSGGSLRNRRISAQQVRRLRKQLTSAGMEQRLLIRGLDPRRADLCVAGAILLDEILARLNASEATLCDLSLREGLVLDYISRHRKEIAYVERYPDVRHRSVLELAERCNYHRQHANQVRQRALLLFDQTRAIHGGAEREREWLEHAALLHDIGTHISYEGHHKHSYYLIKNGGLRGFDPEEIEIIALIARYHRRKAPNSADDGLRRLPRTRRHVVEALAAILRLAEGLDRSHAQVITGLVLENRGAEALLRLHTSADGELEVWAATRHCAPFERMVGKPVRVELTTAADIQPLLA